MLPKASAPTPRFGAAERVRAPGLPRKELSCAPPKDFTRRQLYRAFILELPAASRRHLAHHFSDRNDEQRADDGRDSEEERGLLKEHRHLTEFFRIHFAADESGDEIPD